MNIHEAIKELRSGNSIFRKSDKNRRRYFQYTNRQDLLPLYSSHCEDDEEVYYYALHKEEDLEFSVKEIEAEDWEVFKSIQERQVQKPS